MVGYEITRSKELLVYDVYGTKRIGNFISWSMRTQRSNLHLGIFTDVLPLYKMINATLTIISFLIFVFLDAEDDLWSF